MKYINTVPKEFITFGEFGADEPVYCSAADVKLRSRTNGGLVVHWFDLVEKIGIPLPPGIEHKEDAE